MDAPLTQNYLQKALTVTDTPRMASKKIPVSPFGDKFQFRDRYTDALGKTHQIRRVYDTEQEARQKWIAWAAKKDIAGYEASSPLTVDVWFNRWLDVVDETTQGSTSSAYRETVDNRLRPYLGHLQLSEVDETAIRMALRKLVARGLRTNTIVGAKRVLTTALNAAVREGKLERNPALNVKTPRGAASKQKGAWSFEEVTLFKDYLLNDNGVPWLLLLVTGMRRGEVCGLQWSSVDFEKEEIRVERQRSVTIRNKIEDGPLKTPSSYRTIPVSGWVAAFLRDWRARQAAARLSLGSAWGGGDYVCTSSLNRPFHPSTVGKKTADLCVAAGVSVISTHEIRHTFASRAVEDGMDSGVLMTVLGHANARTTLQYYVHSNSNQVREAMTSLTNRL